MKTPLLFVACCWFAFTIAAPPNSSVIDVYKSKHQRTMEEAVKEIKENLNELADPCCDFAEYACGGFYDREQLPKDQSKWNYVAKAIETSKTFFKEVLEDHTQGIDPEYLKKMREFYSLCVDEDAIEKTGHARELYTTDWPTLLGPHSAPYTLNKVFQKYEMDVIKAFFHYYSWTNRTDSTKMNMEIIFTPTHLSWAYYDGKDLSDVKIKALENYYYEVAKELGALDAYARADAVVYVKLDRALQNVTRATWRGPTENQKNRYNPFTLAEMNLEFPSLDWLTFFKIILRIPVDETFTVNVPDVDALRRFDDFITTVPLRQVINRFMFLSAIQFYGTSTRKMREITQRFQAAFAGNKEQPVRWRECITEVNKYYSEGLAMQFILTLPNDIKDKIQSIIDDVTRELKKTMKTTAWLDAESRKIAEAKVDNMTMRIAYVGKLEDSHLNERYKNFKTEGNYVMNRLSAHVQWNLNYLDRAGKARDKMDWMWGHTYLNGYYDYLGNILSIPAIKLQAPFYLENHRALLYGSLGPKIDLLKAFDPKGIQYDQDGNLFDYQYDKGSVSYSDMLKCFESQYSKFEIYSISQKIDGKRTIRSNSNDNSNLQIMYKAYKSGQIGNDTLPGTNLTPDQLFFVSWAKSYCSVQTEKRTLFENNQGKESFDRFRIIGSLQNSPEFAQAFNCDRGTVMNPNKRKCTFW